MNTNFAAMGLDYGPGQNAFTACRPRSPVDRVAPPVRKRAIKTKLQQSIDALSSFDDRQAARDAKAKKESRSQ